MIRFSSFLCLSLFFYLSFVPCSFYATAYEPSPGDNYQTPQKKGTDGHGYEKGRFLGRQPVEIDGGKAKPQRERDQTQLRLVPVSQGGGPSPDKKHAYSILFVEKMPSEGTVPAEETKNPEEPRFHLAKEQPFDDKEVTKPGQKKIKGEVSMGLMVSPVTEVLIGRGIRMEKNTVETPLMRDDGWRFKIQTNF